jgi:hypothetical protein
MRIATYNVEWFTALFEADDRLAIDRHWSGRRDVRRVDQIAALGLVFRALDADAVLVVEAPDTAHRRQTVRALESFADHFGLRARRAITGFPNGTQQELALLYDPDRMTARHDPRGGGAGRLGEGPAPMFDRSVRVDLDGDGAPLPVTFSKPPLELAIEAEGRALRLIGVHVKSKAPIGAKDAADMRRIARENRRKQLAQCLWLRARVVEDLSAGDDLIVLGDFNDGPGLDDDEEPYGRSGVEIVMGEAGEQHLYDPHARIALAQRMGAVPATARFLVPRLDGGGRHWLSALLDYIMISPRLRDLSPVWRIWHPFDDPEAAADPALATALLTASDHFPVTLDLKL